MEGLGTLAWTLPHTLYGTLALEEASRRHNHRRRRCHPRPPPPHRRRPCPPLGTAMEDSNQETSSRRRRHPPMRIGGTATRPRWTSRCLETLRGYSLVTP